jgi:hypothetical protein
MGERKKEEVSKVKTPCILAETAVLRQVTV